jgi:Fe-S-cluster-containing dehydrogenase component/DMSO reductase anchor subunit
LDNFAAEPPRRAARPAAEEESVHPAGEFQSLIDEFLAAERKLTAVDKFSRHHDQNGASRQRLYRDLIPLRGPAPGEQYAFTVDLDKCSGCKACVSACHSLNGLDDDEVWRTVGLLRTDGRANLGSGLAATAPAVQQHITTACHHCVEPGCLNGCPVLAYDKDPVTGIVRHLDDQCIGCGYCVMKCPYEVPKYSARLGIVRKCDMCANRLAAGEAPACVQACPSEAIQITLVKPAGIKARYRAAGATGEKENTFLPDSPDPRITLPTTRFISQRGLPARAVAADEAQPRLDNPHWPLAIMLLLSQTAAGMFFAAIFAPGFGAGDGINRLILGAFAVFSAGLVASVSHLGQPFKAWRCFLGWRKSWLSREIILFNLLGAVATPLALAALAGELHPARYPGAVRAARDFLAPMSAVVASVGLVAVFASAMVYIDTERSFWRPRTVLGNFFGSTVMLGSAFAAAVLSWGGAAPGAAGAFMTVALAAQTALLAWRGVEHYIALEDANHPDRLTARVINELLPWAKPALALLFLFSFAAGSRAAANLRAATPAWTTLAALAMLGSETVARHVFFAASASKRMPGGVAA